MQPGYAPRIDRSRRQLTGLLTAALAFVGLALAAPSAMANQPPTAQTGAATVSDPASATLAGVVDPNGSDTLYFFVYGVDRYDRHTPLARAGDGPDPVAVSAPITGLTPATTYHVRLVAFNHHGFARGDDVPFTTVVAVAPAPAPAPTPSTAGSSVPATPPVLGQSVNADVRSGTVTVKVPGAAGYVALTDLTSLPVGSILDTREGSVTLRTALPDGKTQAAIFHGGLFEVRQPQGAGGLTEVVLRGALTGCSSGGARAAAVSKKKKRKPPRRLWGSDSKGKFRTRGGNSVATVRGTAWYVEDRCDGTLTRVSRGSVSVYDRGRHRTVVVRAGHSYLARSIR
ncbi:MAG: fibronectin type III domain-containing protein [Solirubrobacteraceae bacterium]